MEQPSNDAARLNPHRRVNQRFRSQFRYSPHYSFHSARVLAAMRTSFHDDQTHVTRNSSLREASMPLQPLNLNREPSYDSVGKKGVHRDYYGYQPSPVRTEPETPSRDHPSPREREVYHYSTPGQYYEKQPFHYHEEEHPFTGYLDDDFDGIPPPPPPVSQHHVAYHYASPPMPPPPQPPPSYNDSSPYAMTPFPYPTCQYSPTCHTTPGCYSPVFDDGRSHGPNTVSPPADTPRPPTPRPPAELHELDIVCGRGAPTNYHYGNQVFKQVIEEYQTAYLCAKRSDKPHLVMKIMDIIKNGGARFVKREKTAGHFSWVEIDSKGAYEKVCQALRDGAPDVRRKAMSASKRKDNS